MPNAQRSVKRRKKKQFLFLHPITNVSAATAVATTIQCVRMRQANEPSEMCINIFRKRIRSFFGFVRGQEEKHICLIFMYGYLDIECVFVVCLVCACARRLSVINRLKYVCAQPVDAILGVIFFFLKSLLQNQNNQILCTQFGM